MDKLLVAAICVAIIAAVGLAYCVAYLEESREKIPLVSLQDLVANKAQYEGKYIKVRGTLKENLDTEIRESYIMTMIPVYTGGDSYTWIPVLVPVKDKYYVYALSEGNLTIALLSNKNYDRYLGTEVTIRGEVDGVKTVNGETFDYVIKAEVINP